VWTVRQGSFGDGFADLVKAQKIPAPAAGEALLVKSKKAVIRGEGLADAEPEVSLNGSVVTLASTGSYTTGLSRIGKGGSAAFKLEYVPFNIRAGGTNPWAAFDGKSAFELTGGKEPVWMIRNGVNDEEQDGNTDFETPWNGVVNGNGAVRFMVAAEGPGSMAIKDGKFEGPANGAAATSPDITFTTEGYMGQAEAYYAVVETGASEPALGAYTSLGSVAAGENRKTITLPGTDEEGYDVYVVLFKDGKVSASFKINTKEGETEVGGEWGHRFVAVASGSDKAAWSADGTIWKEVTMPSTGYGRIVYGNGRFVAYGGGGPCGPLTASIGRRGEPCRAAVGWTWPMETTGS
jgi:hypothetical protein